MEEDDILKIRTAVKEELSKLEPKEAESKKGKEDEPERYVCPVCGASITAHQTYCGNCGSNLEWEE